LGCFQGTDLVLIVGEAADVSSAGSGSAKLFMILILVVSAGMSEQYEEINEKNKQNDFNFSRFWGRVGANGDRIQAVRDVMALHSHFLTSMDAA
jgi:tRNA A58 N-methylase Trm61